MKTINDVNVPARTQAQTLHHGRGVQVGTEIAFTTRFDYMFPKLARDHDSLLEASVETPRHLSALGQAMFEEKEASGNPFNSRIAAVYTYLGQFIDHDITARTDRDGDLTAIEPSYGVKPVDPDRVIAGLANGRRPQLDLDSVYGDGPALILDDKQFEQYKAAAQAFELYDSSYGLALQDLGAKRFDVPRRADGTAIIADMRNDENLIVSQLHAVFLAFHNAMMKSLPQAADKAQRYIQARQLCRWAYQYVVLHDYLPTVCDPRVVEDVLANGPRFIGPNGGATGVFMPLEFSVAAFRFGHSMIRPEYKLNKNETRTIDKLLMVPDADLGIVKDGKIQDKFAIDWSFFLPGEENTQNARIFDPRLANGLRRLPEGDESTEEALRQLAVRNLLRGYNLSIPTGQAISRAMGIMPLDHSRVVHEPSRAIEEALGANDFTRRTPLFYYVLREAFSHGAGEHLGAIGSRMVAETLVSLIQDDPVSVLNHPDARDLIVSARKAKAGQSGLKTPVGTIGTISDLVKAAGAI